MLRYFRRLALVCVLAATAFAQQGDTYLDPSLPEGITVRDIIGRFAAQEQTYKQAREHYTYRQSVRMQTLTDNGFPDGEYDDTFDVTFNDQGERVVKEVGHARDTLKRIRVTPEDIDDIRNRLPFVLTSDEIPEYNIRYKGQQDTGGTHCYVFDITPKSVAGDKRYFEGRIWVDSHEYQIVKSKGKAVPDIYNQGGENLFPAFTTYRELVDGKYWFPSRTVSDDYLQFSTGPIHVVETVQYTNYHRFGAESRIIYDGQEIGNSPQNREQQNQQPRPQAQSQPNPQPGPPARQAPRTQSAQQPAPNYPAQPAQYVEQAIMSLERELSDALTNRQVTILERLLTDDYKLISANGDSEDKFALLDDVHRGAAGSFGQPEDMRVQVNGDTAIATGVRVESVPVGKNRVQSARVRFTDTFTRRAGEWFLVQTREAAAR